MALRIALEVAKEVGVEINLIDLRDCGLNFCDGKEDESGYPPGVGKLGEEVRATEGIIVGRQVVVNGHAAVRGDVPGHEGITNRASGADDQHTIAAPRASRQLPLL